MLGEERFFEREERKGADERGAATVMRDERQVAGGGVGGGVEGGRWMESCTVTCFTIGITLMCCERA